MLSILNVNEKFYNYFPTKVIKCFIKWQIKLKIIVKNAKQVTKYQIKHKINIKMKYICKKTWMQFII